MNIDWEAERYKEDFSFVHRYGEDVLNLIRKPEGKRLLAVDLGCGNGALTAKLAGMGFSVLGIDDSAQMLRTAEELHPELEFRKGNALDFELADKADLIFSNAVFHWIDADRQDQLAENIFHQLKPGGQLVCEFGGKGCAERVHSTLEQLFAKRGYVYPRVFYFPSIGMYTTILEEAGFRVEYAILFDRPTPQKGDHGLKSWISMFVKKPFEGIPDKDREAILEEAEEQLKDSLYQDGQWIVDYVRIRVRAVKPQQ